MIIIPKYNLELLEYLHEKYDNHLTEIGISFYEILTQRYTANTMMRNIYHMQQSLIYSTLEKDLNKVYKSKLTKKEIDEYFSALDDLVNTFAEETM